MATWHIEPGSDRTWILSKEGHPSREETVFESRDDAIIAARGRAGSTKGLVVVHNSNGEVEDTMDMGFEECVPGPFAR